MNKDKFKELLTEVIDDYMNYINEKDYDRHEDEEDYKNINDFLNWLKDGYVIHW